MSIAAFSIGVIINSYAINRDMKMDIIENWKEIRELFKSSFKSSFHYSIATVSQDGSPHITPIGSLILRKPGHTIYFEEFTHRLPSKESQKVCVLAVNSSKLFWLKALLFGVFSKPPAIRLYGVLGKRREATEKEIMLWQKRVKSVSFTKGHEMMWANMRTVREIEFNKAEPVHMGKITQKVWRELSQINSA